MFSGATLAETGAARAFANDEPMVAASSDNGPNLLLNERRTCGKGSWTSSANSAAIAPSKIGLLPRRNAVFAQAPQIGWNNAEREVEEAHWHTRFNQCRKRADRAAHLLGKRRPHCLHIVPGHSVDFRAHQHDSLNRSHLAAHKTDKPRQRPGDASGQQHAHIYSQASGEEVI